MTLTQIKTNFLNSVNECRTLYRHCLTPVGIHSDSGVEAAFLQLHNSWEIFLEETLVSILNGEAVISGDVITPKFTLPNRDLIREIIYQEKSFIEWTRDDNVKKRFERHLFLPNRINSTLDTITVEFRDIIKIRNYIAHSSAQAKNNFVNLYQARVGGNPDTSRACNYLKEVDVENSPNTYFDRYLQTLANAAILIIG
jgi:hypothetical protein